jgi:beta-aspartyl-peptidase (threonine type)
VKAIIVHGGAGKIRRKDEILERIEVCKIAAEKGFYILSNKGSSIDATVEAVKILENHPLFDAGIGAYLTEKGEVELDAGIMNGALLKFGAVAGIKHVKNPIILAKTIMETSKHNFLIGEGAEEFAKDHGMEIVPNEYFITERTKEIFQEKFGDTVGAVAIDEVGRITAAVSTGGTALKSSGRVGDSPIVGSGFYANKLYGAVATGIGEDIMKVVLSFKIMLYIKDGIKIAVKRVIKDLDEINGYAGLIAIDKEGNIEFSYNTEAMFYAFKKEGMIEAEGGI